MAKKKKYVHIIADIGVSEIGYILCQYPESHSPFLLFNYMNKGYEDSVPVALFHFGEDYICWE